MGVAERSSLGAGGGPPATPPLGIAWQNAGLGAVAAAVTVAAAALTPTLPWHAGPVLLVLALVAARDRHWLWGAIGAAVVWVPAATAGASSPIVASAAGLAGLAHARAGEPAAGILAAFADGDVVPAAVLASAIGLGALRWRALGSALVVFGGLVATKQLVAAAELPAAAEVAPWAAVAMVTAAGTASAAHGTRWEAAALAIAGVLVLTRLAAVWGVDGLDRVAAAARIGAVPLVYDGLAEGADPRLAAALVRASPDRDGAVAGLGWERALELGWRPAYADPVVVGASVVTVARGLEARGRGGEALRLLAKHPRDGEVDGLRALYERLQGAPVRWRGAGLGPELPGRFDPSVSFRQNGWVAVEWTARAPLAELRIEGEGTSWEGPPVLEVRVDGGARVEWPVEGAATLRIPGPFAEGPHRLDFRFANDAAGPDGDRNAVVRAIRAD